MASRFTSAHRGVLAVACVCVAARVVPAQTPTARFNANETSIEALQAAFAARTVTCRAVVEHYTRRIGAYDQQGPELNAVLTVNPRAREEADRLDAALKASGPVGPLHCVTVLVKDAFETMEMPTSYGSAAFRHFMSGRDATVVAKLKKAGAIVLAKTTLGEFASGYAGTVSGPIRNPYDRRRHPSGSSGGTGAGLAADFATVGIGGDTGGSVRGPAAAGSLVGFRPTLPLVSRHGSVPFKPSYDSVGPITRTVRDMALVMDAIVGYDPHDPVTAYAIGRAPASFARGLSHDALKSVRVGVVSHPIWRETDQSAPDHRQIRTVFARAVADLARLGATVVEGITLPDISARLRASYDANTFETEAAIDAYFSQFPTAPIRSLRTLVQTGGALLPWRAKALANALGRHTNELAYLQVLKNTEETRQAVLTLMAERQLDALVYPTGDLHPAFIAPDIATNPDVVGDTRAGSNRTLASVLGFPAITVPAGFTEDQMPVGLEFMGRAFDDAKIMGFAYAYEQATRHRRPPSSTPPLPE